MTAGKSRTPLTGGKSGLDCAVRIRGEQFNANNTAHKTRRRSFS
jgi:hypothetical protein